VEDICENAIIKEAKINKVNKVGEHLDLGHN
jgi:hypothetical protein